MDEEFDVEIDREGSDSIKWGFRVRDGRVSAWDRTDPALGDERVIPMWVADMDFPAAAPIREAIRRRAEHGVFGYAMRSERYLDAVVRWMRERHGWRVEREWIVPIAGVVPALHLAVRQFTARGERVLVQRPVYHPFTFAAENNAREVACNALVLDGDRYRMDLDDLESRASDPAVRLAILCSPHNPVGRVWSADELRAFGEICLRHDVLVIADEIHADLVMPGHRFVPYATLSEELAGRCIVCTATSKSFNLAGLQTANLIIADPDIRARMQAEARASGLFSMSPFGIVATQAAYEECGPWLDRAIAYISANLDFLEARVREHMPAVRLIRPQGTYLAWLDFRALGLDDDALGELLLERARVYLDEGRIFGPEGSGFARINVACPRHRLAEALDRIARAVQVLPVGAASAANRPGPSVPG